MPTHAAEAPSPDPVPSDAAGGERPGEGGPVEVRVMSRNLYLGADHGMLFSEEDCPTPLEDLTRKFWDFIRKTGYPERARTIAKEVRARRPHLVGLQEVFTYRTRPGWEGPDGGDGSGCDGWEVELDFLALLLEALKAEGLSYRRANVTPTTDVVLPLRTLDEALESFRVSDSDVILAAPEVTIRESMSHVFQAHVRPVLPNEACEVAVEAPFFRGFGSVAARVGGRDLVFANTHLEWRTVQCEQARELVDALAAERGPVVLLGDINGHRDEGEAYGILTGAGYRDVTGEDTPPHRQPTCCEDAGLGNFPTMNRMQIDHVFVRGPVEPVSFEILGDENGDRTPSGLWPSDHAGVAATVLVG